VQIFALRKKSEVQNNFLALPHCGFFPTEIFNILINEDLPGKWSKI
jgi:hypothetical protein